MSSEKWEKLWEPTLAERIQLALFAPATKEGNFSLFNFLLPLIRVKH